MGVPEMVLCTAASFALNMAFVYKRPELAVVAGIVYAIALAWAKG